MQRRQFIAGALPVAVALCSHRAWAAEAALQVNALASGLWLISGAGGNVLVLATAEGVVLIDGGAPANLACPLSEAST